MQAKDLIRLHLVLFRKELALYFLLKFHFMKFKGFQVFLDQWTVQLPVDVQGQRAFNMLLLDTLTEDL